VSASGWVFQVSQVRVAKAILARPDGGRPGRLDKGGNFLHGKIISAKQRDGVYPYLDENQAAFKEIKKLTLADFPENKLEFYEDGSFYLK
jgi:hypothetical protein